MASIDTASVTGPASRQREIVEDLIAVTVEVFPCDRLMPLALLPFLGIWLRQIVLGEEQTKALRSMLRPCPLGRVARARAVTSSLMLMVPCALCLVGTVVVTSFCN